MITENRAERTLQKMMLMFQRHDEKIDLIEAGVSELVTIFRDAAGKLGS